MTKYQCVPEVEKGDILLIYPDFAKNALGTASYPENHLGLNRLASYIAEQGKSVSVVNTTGLPAATHGPEEFASFLESIHGRYSALGFHINSWNISHIVRILKKIPQLEGKLVVFGGPLATAMPREVLETFSSIGLKNLALVQGYGEFKLDEILENLSDIDGLEGVWSYDGHHIHEGSLQRLTSAQMSSLPLLNPDYNTFYQLFYKPFQEQENSPFTIDMIYSAQGLDTNHGCPYNCSYCSVHIFGNKISEYSPQRVCEEMENMAQKTGVFMFTFTNSNLLFLKKEWLLAFCNEIIKRKINHYATWSGYHHPLTLNLLSAKEYRLMKEAGCDQIVVGIQSVEPEILKKFNRLPNTYEIFKKINAAVREAGLELVIDYIRGVPGENTDTIEEFYRFCVENNIEMREFLLKIYPNTEITSKSIDFSDYELVPITGDLAEGLDSYAVLPRHPNPKNEELSALINRSNAQIKAKRRIRFGQHYIDSQQKAQTLEKNEIPADPAIPEKVKKAAKKMLHAMLNPPAQQSQYSAINQQGMLKMLILADETAPPMVRKMQERLMQELGREKFEKLKQQYKR